MYGLNRHYWLSVTPHITLISSVVPTTAIRGGGLWVFKAKKQVHTGEPPSFVISQSAWLLKEGSENGLSFSIETPYVSDPRWN